MSTACSVRRANERDLNAIMAIFEGRSDWLRDVKSSDQWASVSEWKVLLRYLIRRGHTWVLVADVDGGIVGTVTVDSDPDRDFWSDDERQVPALYVSKLATDVGLKGQELGGQLLAWVHLYAASRFIRVVRLDAWKTSEGLRHYYASRGWRYVRTEDLPHRESGSLFEGRVEIPSGTTVATGPQTGQFDTKLMKLMAASTRRPHESYAVL
jgi:hypothetical protein